MRSIRRALRSRRSVSLLVLGVMFLLLGAGYLGIEDQLTASPTAAQAYRAHLALMPLNAWAGLFLASGVFGALCGLTHRHRLGFPPLLVTCVGWGVEFLASWALTGYARAGISACLFLGLGAVMLVIAGWPDPVEIRVADLFAWVDRQQQ